MRLLLILLVTTTALLAQEAPAKPSSIDQRSNGDCSTNIVSNGSGAVTVIVKDSCNAEDRHLIDELNTALRSFRSQNPKTIAHLNELIDQKDIELAKKTREVQDWVNKYNELAEQLKNQPANNELRSQAADALDRGDLTDAEALLKRVKDLQAELDSRELATRAEQLIPKRLTVDHAQDPSVKVPRDADTILLGRDIAQAQKMAVEAFRRKPTDAARKAMEDAFSFPVGWNSNYFNDSVLSTDGKRVLHGKTIRDLPTENSPTGKTVQLNSQDVDQVAGGFSSDGSRVVTAGHRFAEVFDAATGNRLLTLKGHTDTVCVAKFFSNDRRIVTASQDKTIRLWDAGTGAQIKQWDGYPGCSYREIVPINFDVQRYIGDRLNIDVSPGGQEVVTRADHEAMVWDAIAGGPLPEFNGFLEIAFTPDGRRVLTTDSIFGKEYKLEGEEVRVWDAASHRLLSEFKGKAAALSSDGTRLAVEDIDGTIRVLDTSSQAKVAQFGVPQRVMYPIFLSPHGDRLLALSSSHSAFVFDVKTSGMLGTMDPAFNTALWSLIWAPDGKHVLTLYFGRCNLWDTTTGRWMGLLDGSGEIPKATFTPDSTRILASGSIYNVITGSDPDLKQAPSPVP